MLKLVIGNKNLSSWSLRPWLLLRQADVPFEEVPIRLDRDDTAEQIRRYSPSGKVPALLVGDVAVWDSLAIAEFLAEERPELWPAQAEARAVARSVSAEMHSGFADLRRFMPMDFTARFGPPGMVLRGVAADIARITTIWNDCRKRYGRGGPFLFGQFSIADAMYAPVCSRFTTYAVPLDEISSAYVAAVMALPAMQEWAAAAAAEVAAEAREAATAPEDPPPTRVMSAPPPPPLSFPQPVEPLARPVPPSTPVEPAPGPAPVMAPPVAPAPPPPQPATAPLRPPEPAPAPPPPSAAPAPPAPRPPGGGDDALEIPSFIPRRPSGTPGVKPIGDAFRRR